MPDLYECKVEAEKRGEDWPNQSGPFIPKHSSTQARTYAMDCMEGKGWTSK